MYRRLVAAAFAVTAMVPALTVADDPDDADGDRVALTPERLAINAFGQLLDDGDIAGAVAALGPNARVGALWFFEPSCAAQFGKPHVLAPAEREQLIKCLIGLNPKAPATATPPLNALELEGGMLLGVKIDSSGVSLLHPIGAAPGDSPMLTNDGRAVHAARIRWFLPSDPVAHLVHRSRREATAVVRVCASAAGKITKAQVLQRSHIPRFDREALAAAKSWPRTAYKPYGHPEPVCEIITLSLPLLLFDRSLRSKEPPPPPPPFSASRHHVKPEALEHARVAGTTAILPDARTRDRMTFGGRASVSATLDVCLTAGGQIEHVSTRTSSRYDAYDAEIVDTITRTWKFRPVLVDGKPTPVCAATVISFPPPLPASARAH
ncbi:MAG: energy transducer TonB [Kofleriaceae bacterium]